MLPGLDDIMLKKMILAYYKGMYLDDTTILIDLMPEDLDMDETTLATYMSTENGTPLYNVLSQVLKTPYVIRAARKVGGGALYRVAAGALESVKQNRILLTEEGKAKLEEKFKDEFYPFEIIGGDVEAGIGEDGHIYLCTKGMVRIYYTKCENCEKNGDSDNCTDCEKIIYYEEETLDKIYNEHYLQKLNDGNEAYANSTLKYLSKCYTYTTVGSSTEYDGDESKTSYDEENNTLSDAIKMYTARTVKKTQSTWKYKVDGIDEIERNLEPIESFPVRAQYIQYSNKVAEYATPVELMVDLLEITGSKDFLNAFIETAGKDNYINLKLYAIKSETQSGVREEKSRTTTIEGKIEYSAKITGYSPKTNYFYDGADTATLNFNVEEQEKDGKIEVKINLEELENWKDGYRYQVELYANEEKFEKINKVFLKGSDTNKTLWTVSLPTTNFWNQKSNVTEIKEITNEEQKYDIAVTKIKTWYATLEAKNIVKKSITIENLQENSLAAKEEEKYYIKTLWNEKDLQEKDELQSLFNYIDALDKIEAIESEEEKRVEEIYRSKDESVFIIKNENETKEKYTRNDCLNIQFNQTLLNGDTAYYKYYKIDKMVYEDTDIITTTVYYNYNEELYEGLSNGKVTVQYDTNRTFLGLLSNDTGEYRLGAAFKPQTNAEDTGKLVEYNDLYGQKSKVGELLENGAEMLYTLLESSERTQGLVETMKYMMNEFKNNNYSVTEFKFYIFDRDNNKWKPVN